MKFLKNFILFFLFIFFGGVLTRISTESNFIDSFYDNLNLLDILIVTALSLLITFIFKLRAK